MENDRIDRKKYIFVILLMVSLLLLSIFWISEFIMLYANGAEPSESVTETPEDSSKDEGAQAVPEVLVSHSSGFYKTAIMLEMYPQEGYDILYTVTLSTSRSATDGRFAGTGEPYMFMGGKNPDPFNVDTETHSAYNVSLFNSSEGRLKTYKYSQPLDLVNYSDFSALVVSVKAALYRGNLRISPVSCFTYILGSGKGDKEFRDIFGSMLISITVDDELLYNYEKGIFISGKNYDDAIAAGVAIDPWTPRNYNQRGSEWERLAHIDFFETDGSLVLSQVCGIRVAGGTSRGASIKSLKLVADGKYEDNDRFYYQFFEGAKDVLGEPITSYKKLVLRNPRNDLGGTMIRDQLIHKLGGYVDVDYQEGRNAVVYLNGKYYSIMCLHESLDAEFMEDHYFVNKENVAAFLIKSDQYQFRYKQESGTQEQFKCFLSDMNYLIYNDFTDEDGMARIREVIDVENFCRYMAFQIFIVNEDWPHNNVLAWRYYGPENSSIKGMDGRWRFILKDLDFGLVDPTRETFNMCLNDGLYGGEPCIGTVLRNLIKNAEFRNIFRENCIYVAETLSSEYLIEQIDKAIDDIRLDMGLYVTYNGMSIDGWLQYLEQWKVFAKERKDYFLKYLDTYVPAL